jgi:Sec-independent protein translocase protein TatA
MPEMAKKIGKFMAEFRGTANEFKETWRREVDLENTTKHFDLNNLEAEVEAEKQLALTNENSKPALAPDVKDVDPATLEKLKLKAAEKAETEATVATAANDKKNWL